MRVHTTGLKKRGTGRQGEREGGRWRERERKKAREGRREGGRGRMYGAGCKV